MFINIGIFAGAHDHVERKLGVSYATRDYIIKLLSMNKMKPGTILQNIVRDAEREKLEIPLIKDLYNFLNTLQKKTNFLNYFQIFLYYITLIYSFDFKFVFNAFNKGRQMVSIAKIDRISIMADAAEAITNGIEESDIKIIIRVKKTLRERLYSSINKLIFKC